MPTDSGERRASRVEQIGTHTAEPEHVPCPRCDSTDTKFCYYNNYNLSQPRHFCKSCRRYWTRGGTLRNVPVGGGTRKASSASSSGKRSRTAGPAMTNHDPFPANPVSMMMMGGMKPDGVGSPLSGGSFTTLLNTQGDGFLALGGFGLGLGTGLNEMGLGFGLGPAVWPGEEGGGGGGGGGGESGYVHGSSSSGCNNWQMGGAESGLADSGYFGWPDLAISSQGKGLE